ncbi:MAG: hypothetical protein HRT72_13290, partial [Flavobacteriales bacterium]|nr:hypothetical protein [Flavobacteriales bacterium]
LGVEAQNDFALGTTIIPIGVNYSDPHHHYNDLLINVGEPIKVSDYKETFLENERKAATELTNTIKERLEENTIVIEDENMDELVENIEKIYRSKLREDSEGDMPSALHNFQLSKAIVEAVTFFKKNDPDRVIHFKLKLTPT